MLMSASSDARSPTRWTPTPHIPLAGYQTISLAKEHNQVLCLSTSVTIYQHLNAGASGNGDAQA